MKASVNGVSLVLPTFITPAANAQLSSVITRAGFVREAFGETDKPGIIPPGTRVLLAFGEQNLRMCAGEVNIQRYRGHVLGEGPFVIATFEPGFMLPRRGEESGTKFTGVVIADIRKAVSVAKHGFARTPVTYTVDPSLSRAEQWVEEFEQAFRNDPENTYLAHDLETEYKSKNTDESELETRDNLILRYGFAWKDAHALTLPADPQFLPLVKYLYSHPAGKIGWNSAGFDDQVLAANNIPVNGEQFDAIDAWHCTQSHLPRRLEFVASFYADILPWKHTNKSDFAIYNAKDVDATIRIWHGLVKEMRAVEIPDFQVAA